MDTFDRKSLQGLIDHQCSPCVSVFFTTHPAGSESEQDSVRLKNLLRSAELKLSTNWMRRPDAERLLEPARRLHDNESFWANRSAGLAVFVAPGCFEAYRVPIPFDEHVSVAHRFRVRPLLPLLERQFSFLLLSISENLVALYDVHERSIQKLKVPGLPTKLNDLLCYTGADRGAQVHSAMRGARGKQGAVFHGQGGQPDTAKEEQLAFCDAINEAVTNRLGQSTRPLLLAAVESMSAIYRKKNTYKHLLDITLLGNHDYESLSERHDKAWRAVQPLRKLEAASDASQYSDLLGTPRACDKTCEVVLAAMQGSVDTLFYDPSSLLNGKWDMSINCITVTNKTENDDLVEVAAVETLRHGGTIHVMPVELPTNAPMAAILRF